jgi:hypothetical protein
VRTSENRAKKLMRWGANICTVPPTKMSLATEHGTGCSESNQTLRNIGIRIIAIANLAAEPMAGRSQWASGKLPQPLQATTSVTRPAMIVFIAALAADVVAQGWNVSLHFPQCARCPCPCLALLLPGREDRETDVLEQVCDCLVSCNDLSL